MGFDGFDCNYRPLRTFLPDPVIWLEVQPAEEVLVLRRALHDTGLLDPELPHTEDFVPHMTITEGLSGGDVTQARFEELSTTVAGGSFRCGDICFIVPDEEFRFSFTRRLPLAP